jgi:hypothetical protein
MTFRSLRHILWIAGFVLVGASAVLLTTGESAWHPPHGTLWQSHAWLINIPDGAFGLEEWRLEGINTDTTVYLGSFHFSTSTPAIAVVVAAIGLGSFFAACLLCFARWHTIFHAREYDTNAA